MVREASLHARAFSPFACSPLKSGMNADSTVVSPRIRQSRLGIVKAATKMSIDVPAPKRAAVNTSRAKPVSLDASVPRPMFANPRTISPPRTERAFSSMLPPQAQRHHDRARIPEPGRGYQVARTGVNEDGASAGTICTIVRRRPGGRLLFAHEQRLRVWAERDRCGGR